MRRGLRPILWLVPVLLLSLAPRAAAGDPPRLPPASAAAYAVHKVVVGQTTEYRFLYGRRHFGSLIDAGGTFAFRPHPGCDPNGWGSTWYAQPFLPGAVLQHTVISPPDVDAEGIDVAAGGQVARGAAGSYGTWNSALEFRLDAGGRRVTAAGQMAIDLAGPLSEATGDLNLYKIASNYLQDVPLQGGGSGDTGDMQEALVAKSPGTLWFAWRPPQQPAHFPTDRTDYLAVHVLGRFNNVDTQRQGYEPIAAAFKPGLQVVLSSRRPGAGLMFGAVYDLAERQHFWTDNVGITPLIPRSSPDTEFLLDVGLESEALELCGYLPWISGQGRRSLSPARR